MDTGENKGFWIIKNDERDGYLGDTRKEMMDKREERMNNRDETMEAKEERMNNKDERMEVKEERMNTREKWMHSVA